MIPQQTFYFLSKHTRLARTHIQTQTSRTLCPTLRANAAALASACRPMNGALPVRPPLRLAGAQVRAQFLSGLGTNSRTREQSRNSSLALSRRACPAASHTRQRVQRVSTSCHCHAACTPQPPARTHVRDRARPIISEVHAGVRLVFAFSFVLPRLAFALVVP